MTWLAVPHETAGAHDFHPDPRDQAPNRGTAEPARRLCDVLRLALGTPERVEQWFAAEPV